VHHRGEVPGISARHEIGRDGLGRPALANASPKGLRLTALVESLPSKRCGLAQRLDEREPHAAFQPLFEVLRLRRDAGWISLEAFDFTPGADAIANESPRHLKRQIAEMSL
jgi:hypothetical protein